MSKKKETISNEEAIRNLLIISLLKDGVDPKIIEKATGIPEMTIRGKFPMKGIIKSKKVEDVKDKASEKERTPQAMKTDSTLIPEQQEKGGKTERRKE
jgi:hypothetical protein